MKFQDSSFNGLKVTAGTKSVTHIHARKQQEERSSDFSRITPGLRLLPPRLGPHRSGGASPPTPQKQFWIHACHFRTCNPPPPPGADPGFLDRGFKFRKGGLFSQCCLIFSKIPHENEIIQFKRGVGQSKPPLDPPLPPPLDSDPKCVERPLFTRIKIMKCVDPNPILLKDTTLRPE